MSTDTTVPDDDWPRCRKCQLHEWEHGEQNHRFQWPPLTAREIRVLDRIFSREEATP